MTDFLLELALPRTDAGVYGQTLVMAVFWAVVLASVLVFGVRREYRNFAIGLAVINFAWFAARTVH